MGCCGWKSKLKLMMNDDDIMDVEYEIDSDDDDDASPTVVLYDRNTPNHHHLPLDPLLTDYAQLSIHVFNSRNHLAADMQCIYVELVRATSCVCNGVYLKLEVAAKNRYFGDDAETHTFSSKIWYKGDGGPLADADVIEVVPSSGSYTCELHFKSEKRRKLVERFNAISLV